MKADVKVSSLTTTLFPSFSYYYTTTFIFPMVYFLNLKNIFDLFKSDENPPLGRGSTPQHHAHHQHPFHHKNRFSLLIVKSQFFSHQGSPYLAAVDLPVYEHCTGYRSHRGPPLSAGVHALRGSLWQCSITPLGYYQTSLD